jgi:hypothetical protein
MLDTIALLRFLIQPGEYLMTGDCDVVFFK